MATKKEKKQCKAITKANEKCRYEAVLGGYCMIHYYIKEVKKK